MTYSNLRSNAYILVLVPQRTQRLVMAIHFEFSLNLTGKVTMAFLTGQSWCVLKSWYAHGGPVQGFWHCLANRLGLVLSVCGAAYEQPYFEFFFFVVEVRNNSYVPLPR